MLTPEQIDILTPLPRHERARRLLEGEFGPLYTMPLDPSVAAMAYLVYLAWIRCRVHGGFLAGRPSYEAAETLRSRVSASARRSGTFAEFGHQLFSRLRLSTASMTREDALWWRLAQVSHAQRWRTLRTDLVLTEACVAIGAVLDPCLRLVPDPKPEPTYTPPEEPADVAQ